MTKIKAILVAIFCAWSAPNIALADAAKDKAVSDFVAITIPNVAQMAPFISKSVDIRATAFNDFDEKEKACSLAGISTVKGDEPVAGRVSNLCLALVYWLQNDDANTCKYLKWANDTEDFKKPNSAKTIIAYKTATISKIKSDLEKAVNCKSKNEDYWSKQSIDTYFSMISEVKFAENGDVRLNPAKLQKKLRKCEVSNINGARSSYISEAAALGCAAIAGFSTNDNSTYCESWFKAQQKIAQADKKDKNFTRATELSNSFTKLINQTSCGAIVKTLQTKSDSEKNIDDQVHASFLIYEKEQAAANDAMDLASAASESSNDPNREAKVCTHLTLAREKTNNAQMAALKMVQLNESENNIARFEALKASMKQLNAEVSKWCQ